MVGRLLLKSLGFFGALALSLTGVDASVVISEILASNHEIEADSFGVHSDWLELYNDSDQAVSLGGGTLVVGVKGKERWTLPSRDLAPGAFLRIWCSGKDTVTDSGEWHSSFRLSAKGDVIKLFRKGESSPAFVFDYRSIPQFPDISCGFQQRFDDHVFVGDGAAGRFTVPSNGRDDRAWMRTDFRDDDWTPVRSPVGFDRKRHPSFADELRTDVGMLFRDTDAGAFIRYSFQGSSAQRGMELSLNVRFKDGFVAYLNGQPLAESNVPGRRTWNSRALEWVWEPREEMFAAKQLAASAAALKPGKNMLAIHSMLAKGAHSDLLMKVTLSGRKVNRMELDRLVYFDYPTPEEVNGEGYPSIAAKPRISVKGGICRKPVRVELSLPPGETGEIRFTLDGSFPDRESALYTGALRISGSKRLRARSFHPEKNPSLVANENYCFLASSMDAFSSNLPIVVFDSLREPIEGEDYSPMQLSVFDVGGDGRARLSRKPTVSTRAAVKLRGSSTLTRAKKGYRFETRDEFGADEDVSLLGMPADSDWILYGPYNFDQAMIRNALVYELSNQMGRYAVRTRFVEAFVQSDSSRVNMTDYVGLYLLMEKIGRSKNRVDIRKPAMRNEEGDKVSGGYIFKVDRLGPDEDGFRAGRQQFVHVYPKERDISNDQSTWLASYLDEALASLAGRNFRDPQKGYAAYLDVDAWIDQHLIQEITRNPDAYRYSTFLTKPRGGKLQAGPTWDFDRAMRTNTDEEWVGRAARPTGWIWGGEYNWGKLLMDDPAYARKFRRRGAELLETVWSLENVHRVIDQMAAEIREAQGRNHRRWGYLNPEEWEEEIEDLKEWMADRSAWLERRFLAPPEVVARSGRMSPPCELAMVTRVPGAKIYYTLNNSSPGLVNDRISPFAKLYEGAIKIEKDTVVTAAILTDGKWSDETTVYCVTQPNPIAVTEIMYKPRAGSHLEFIELQNLSDEPVEMEEMSLSGAVDFDFSDSDRTELAPGERVLVVNDLKEFKAAYATGDLFIAGEFDGSLSNTSGEITLEGPIGEELLNVYYVDAWYPSTDGGGYSLELTRPSLDPAAWRDPRNWRASEVRGGSPGRDGAIEP